MQHIIGPRIPLGTGGVGTEGLGAGQRKARTLEGTSPVPTLGLGARAAACLLGQEPSALTSQETSRPRGQLLGPHSPLVSSVGF